MKELIETTIGQSTLHTQIYDASSVKSQFEYFDEKTTYHVGKKIESVIPNEFGYVNDVFLVGVEGFSGLHIGDEYGRSSSWKSTYFIPFDGITYFKIKTFLSGKWGTPIAFYDENKICLGVIDHGDLGQYERVVYVSDTLEQYPTAKYVRFCTTDKNLYPFEIVQISVEMTPFKSLDEAYESISNDVKDVEQEVETKLNDLNGRIDEKSQNPLFRKSYLCFGDSYTTNSMYVVDGVDMSYASLISRRNNMALKNRAVSGGHTYHVDGKTTNNCLIDDIDKYVSDIKNSDYITFANGLNDFSKSQTVERSDDPQVESGYFLGYNDGQRFAFNTAKCTVEMDVNGIDHIVVSTKIYGYAAALIFLDEDHAPCGAYEFKQGSSSSDPMILTDKTYDIVDILNGKKYTKIQTGKDSPKYLQVFSVDENEVTFKCNVYRTVEHDIIGNIDDENTNTFYGAWNHILKTVYDANPNVKVGFILNDGWLGRDNESISGNIQIYDNLKILADYWGIQYLDLSAKQNKNIMLTDNTITRENVNPYIVDLRNSMYRNPDIGNNHPNLLAHQVRSYLIEDFMRSL